MAMNNTSATLLARRWESALLVNVDNFTLQRLLNNTDAMAALMKIEGFRSLNQDIETIINKTDSIKKKRKEHEEGLTSKEKKELSDAEKEIKPSYLPPSSVPVFRTVPENRKSECLFTITRCRFRSIILLFRTSFNKELCRNPISPMSRVLRFISVFPFSPALRTARPRSERPERGLKENFSKVSIHDILSSIL